ncbi:MAG: response regulator [Gammaproteobacteria bacterium]|nr:response regulator [Gammaproteobacteria bacterium]
METPRLRILCVEDDADIREIFQLALEAGGDAEVATCGSGQEALALYATQRFDVVLLDVMMPQMDGPATLAELRRLPQGAAAAVIFVTAKATHDELQRLRRLGARGVITKPFDPLTLLTGVRALLAA